MLRSTSLLSLLSLISLTVQAQIRPLENSILNYRLVGFSTPAEPHTNSYTFEIASGSFDDEIAFGKNIIKKVQTKSNRIIEEVPTFGSQYTWRIIYSFNKSSKTVSKLFHFSTGTVPEIDTNIIRLKISKSGEKYKDAYVFLDDNKTLYDMNGVPVWYLPKIEGIPITPRNLKLSREGTITFVFDPPYEIDYNGNVLWKGPAKGILSGDYSEHYHHQFSRLHNGHYMILGQDSVLWRPNNLSAKNNNLQGQSNDAATNISAQKIQFGTIIEYDEHGNIVWSWKSSEYFTRPDITYFNPAVNKEDIDVHENSFHFDEKNHCIYVSYKNISRILKIKYPEGTVLNDYCGTIKQDGKETSTSLFCGQHSLKQTSDDNILLFNNNSCQPGSFPEVEILAEPQSPDGLMKLIWKYECTSELKFSCGFPSGGNVIELADHSIFVSTAAPDSKVFIVNRDKEILWCALPQRWNAREKKWDPIPEYRASIIQDRESLEHLIWHGDPNIPQRSGEQVTDGSKNVNNNSISGTK